MATEQRHGRRVPASYWPLNARSVERVVGLAEAYVTTAPDELIVTYALGTCVGLTLWDPVARVAALAHCMLPVSRIDPEKAQVNPYMFVDTGVSRLLQAVFDQGATRRNLVARVAGAADEMPCENVFRVGHRNQAVVRRVLWRNDVLIASEDLGGKGPRTLALDTNEGLVWVRTSKGVAEL